MALSDFLRINLPYGMKKNEAGEWLVFNREYLPLGWNSNERSEDISQNDAFAKFPIYTKFEGLTDNYISELIGKEKSLKRDSNGKINMVFFYDGGSNPYNEGKSERYFNILLSLMELKSI